MRKIGLAVLILAGYLPTVAFAEDAESWLTTEDAFETSQKFAVCAGLFEALSDTTEAWGKENSSAFFHNANNGAKLVAMWFLAIEHEQRTGTPTPIEQFASHVDGNIDSSRTYFLGLIEMGGVTATQEDMDKCAALNELQTKVVNLIRASALLQDGQSGE